MGDLLMWIAGYLLAFGVTARVAFIRLDRKTEVKVFNGSVTKTITGEEKLNDDKGSAVAIGLAWPAVWLILSVRQALRWTVLRPTKRQRMEQRAAEIADLKRRAKELGLCFVDSDDGTAFGIVDLHRDPNGCTVCGVPHSSTVPHQYPVVPIVADPALRQIVDTP